MKIVKTVRDSPVNVQLYKVAQRSAVELQKLAELEPLPSPEVQRTTDRRELIERLLTELLGDAIAAHKVRCTGWFDEQEFVDDLLKFLLGEPHRGLATNIIAADAEHGRFRDEKCAYPGRDPMRTDTQARSASEGLRCQETPAPRVSADATQPMHPAAPIPLPSGEGAGRRPAGEGLSALMKAKPAPTEGDDGTTIEPPMNSALTPSDTVTSDRRPPTRNPLMPHTPACKNSTTFSAKPCSVIYLGPASQAEFDRMFHPWAREF